MMDENEDQLYQNETSNAEEHSHGILVHATTTIPLVRQQAGDPHVLQRPIGLNARDESTHYPVFMHFWATNLPGGTRAALRSDVAQARRLLKASNNKERAKAPTTPGPSHNPRGGPDSKYSLSGKAADRITHAPSLPLRCFPVMPGHSKGLAPHGANFGGLDVLPPAPPHWRRHGKMVEAEQVHVEWVRV